MLDDPWYLKYSHINRIDSVAKLGKMEKYCKKEIRSPYIGNRGVKSIKQRLMP